MSSKKTVNGESKSGSRLKGSPTINPPVPILNIPNPGGSSASKSPQPVVSSTVESSQHRNPDEPEVMVLDDDDEMDAEVNTNVVQKATDYTYL